MVLTVRAGCDSSIVDQENLNMAGMMLAAEALMGLDRHCMIFNKVIRVSKIGPPKAVA